MSDNVDNKIVGYNQELTRYESCFKESHSKSELETKSNSIFTRFLDIQDEIKTYRLQPSSISLKTEKELQNIEKRIDALFQSHIRKHLDPGLIQPLSQTSNSRIENKINQAQGQLSNSGKEGLSQPLLPTPPSSTKETRYNLKQGIASFMGWIASWISFFWGGNPSSAVAVDQSSPVSNLPSSKAALSLEKTGLTDGNQTFLKAQGVKSFTSIRGDGNCYYRAIMYGFLKEIVTNPSEAYRRTRFAEIAGEFQRVKTSNNSLFIEALEQAKVGEKWRNIAELDQDFMTTVTLQNAKNNETSETSYLGVPRIGNRSLMDLAMVQAARDLLVKTVRDIVITEDRPNANSARDLKLKELIGQSKPDHDDTVSDDDYLKNTYLPQIMKMGQDAEGATIELNLIGKVLNFSVTQYNMFGYHLHVGNLDPQGSSEHVHILLRPGHYDLLGV